MIDVPSGLALGDVSLQYGQVQILTEAEGLAPDEIERLVTFPIEVEMNGLPKVTEVRSQSKFGLSVVTVVFEDRVDTYFARQLVGQKLQDAQGQLPAGVRPELDPITTGLGEIFQYTLEGPARLIDKRTIQDWIVRPILRTVSGVTEVNSFGGALKQYQVVVNPDALKAYDLTLRDVFEAVELGNANAGGGYVDHGSEQYLIRGLGLIGSPEDLANTVVTARNGRPIMVRDVAEVAVGPTPRQGAVTVMGRGEAVAGIVMKLKGENSRDVIRRVKEKLPAVQAALPPGVRLEPFYDQTELVEKAVGTVEKALVEGGVLVVAVLFAFLWHVRSALVVAITIPLSMLLAFGMMRAFDIPGNLMSLGGLAIGIGMMVDAAIVMVENIFRHLAEDGGSHDIRHVVLGAAKEVARPITFAITIIVVVFLPLFTLQGMEGKLFAPMAFTIAFALLGSLLLSLTLVPVLATLLLRGRIAEQDNPIVALAKRIYLPVLAWALGRRAAVVGGALAALVGALALYPFIGSEFMPQLEEGSILVQPMRLPSVSLPKAIAQSTAIEKALLEFPEVEKVVSRTGRPEVANDPMGIDMSDVYVMLKPRETWKRSKEAIVAAMAEELEERVPGVNFSFTQPIAMRVDELVAGVKTQVAVKVFGDDLEVLQAKAREIQAILGKIRGAGDLQVEQVAGLAQVQIAIDRARTARLGIRVADVNEVIETAIGGKEATTVQEGQRRFAVSIRLPEARRKALAAIGEIRILALWAGRMNMSVSASVGFIALFGVAVQNGVIMVSYFNTLRQEGLPLREAILHGAAVRLRPVLMTALVASLGLIPLAISSGIGSEVQRPLAWVVIGGLVSSTLLTLLVLPVVYGWMERDPQAPPGPEDDMEESGYELRAAV